MGWLAELWRDVRAAGRAIRATPGVSAVVIGSIAIGIGVNTTVFSWIQARVLQPLPGVARGGAFYSIEVRNETGAYSGLSWPDYGDLVRRLPAFREIIAFRLVPLNVGAADWAERSYGMLVSGNYFQALGLSAERGRLIESADTAVPGGAPVVVVSHRFWRARLAGAPDIVGRTLRVNDRPFTIVGVAPPGFVGTVMGLTLDLWTPATAVPLLVDGSRELDARAQRGYLALGDLAPGASRADGQRELDAAMQALAAMYPETNRSIAGEVRPQWQSPRGPQRSLMTALAMLQGAMLLVLAVVAGNTTNLVLARASSRRRDVGVRLALGATRARIVRLIVVENLLLAATGAALGAALAVWGTTALRAAPLPTPGGLELTFETRVDAVSLAFALALGLLAGLAVGVPAGLQLSRTRPLAVLRSSGAAAGRSAARDVFLALETALAIVVLAVAAMFIRSFNDTQATDPGFRREGVLLATYDLRGRSRAVSAETSAEFATRMLDELRGLPSVESAAIASMVPMDIHGMSSRMVSLEGRARPDGSLDQVLTSTVTPGYFRTMGIDLVEGSDFVELRNTSAPPEAVINEEFVRQFVESGGAIGRRLETAGRTFTIVGVVRTSLYNAFGEEPAPFIYLSYRDRPSPLGEIHARVRGGAERAVAAEIRAVFRRLDATLPIYNVRTLAEHVDANLVFQRIPARMFVVLGPLVLVLVAIGISAVASHAVGQRRREVGTRLALGASAGQVIGALVADTLRVVAFGMAAGVAAAVLVTEGALDGEPRALLLVGGVAALFLAGAVVATWLPARRASRVDLVEALKAE